MVGISSCWIERSGAEVLQVGFSLVGSVLVAVRGRKGIDILVFNFSTWFLIFVINCCFRFFVADEFVMVCGIVDM